MKKLMTNSFSLGFLLLLLFRIAYLIISGPSTDGNLLILVVLPWLVFSSLIYLVKRILQRAAMRRH